MRIHNLAIFQALTFRTRGIFKILLNFDQACSKPCHRTVYPGIIQSIPCIFITLCNACKYRSLANSESWIIQNLFIIASWCILRTLLYLQKSVNPVQPLKFRTLAHCQFWNIQNPDIFKTYSKHFSRFKMECFAKIVKVMIIFPKCSILYLWQELNVPFSQ